MLSEATVQEGEFSVDEFVDGTVVAEHVLEKKSDFLGEVLFDLVVEVAKLNWVGGKIIDPLNLQPLGGKIIGEPRRLLIGEHPGYLGCDFFLIGQSIRLC